MNPPGSCFKYRAFVTYSHRDKHWADWLHKFLETYPVPHRVRQTAGRDGPVPARLFPVFRDREELPTSADLGDQIRSALETSACLVVICSPNSAGSRWVNEEILTFKKLKRENRILAIIVGGEPNASDKAGMDATLECFPPALIYQMDAGGNLTEHRVEPLAADARPHGDGKRNAALKVVAGVLGIAYDSLKRREEHRRAMRNLALTSLLFSIVGASALFAWQKFNRGTLNADAIPQSAVVTIDDSQVGARVRNFKRPAGKHVLRAEAPDHYPLVRSIHLGRGETVHTRFWLDDALVWQPAPPNTKSPNIQSGAVLFPSGKDTILAHNELGRISFLSTASGGLLGEVPVEQGNARGFAELDLGDDVGKIILSSLDRAQTGAEILALATEVPPRPIWEWHGPPTNFQDSAGLSLTALSTQGTTPFVVTATRVGMLYFIDGLTGQTAAEIRLSDAPLPFPPFVRSFRSAAGSGLVASFRTGQGIKPSQSPRDLPLAFIGIDVSSRNLSWRREFGPGSEGRSADSPSGKGTWIVVWNASDWRVIDPITGKTTCQGSLQSPLTPWGFALFDLPENQGQGLLLEYADPTKPMEAFKVADGSLLWKGPSQLDSRSQPGQPGTDRRIQLSDGCLLVNLKTGLAAIDTRDGRVTWSTGTETIGVLAGDCDGDGREDVLVSERFVQNKEKETRLSCFDGQGARQWSVLLGDPDADPWRLVPSGRRDGSHNILLHRHAGMIALFRPKARVLWEHEAATPIRATPLVITGPSGRPLVISTADWGAGAHVRAFDGLESTELWSPGERFTDNRSIAVADLDGSGVAEVVGIGHSPEDNSVRLLSYAIADGTQTRNLPLEIDGWFSVTPVVADFRANGKCDVALNTWDNRSVALVDGRNGKTVWKFSTNGPNLGGLSSGDLNGDGKPEVMAFSGDGWLYALRGEDGQLLWKAELLPGGGLQGNGLSAPVLVKISGQAEPLAVAIDASGRCHALDARTGTTVWTSQTSGGPGVCGSAVLVGQILLVPQSSAGLISYDAATGTERWRSPLGKATVSTPQIMGWSGKPDSAVFFVSTDGRAFVLSLSDGKVLWEDQVTSKPVEADPVITDLNGDGIPEIIIADLSGTLRVLDGAGNFARPQSTALPPGPGHSDQTALKNASASRRASGG